MSITMIGLDIAKSVFQVHAVDDAGQAVTRRKLLRRELPPFFEKQQPCTVVMEACGAAHHWARVLTGFGHEDRWCRDQEGGRTDPRPVRDQATRT